MQNFIKVLLAAWLLLLAQYRSGDKIKKNEMGGACSMYRGEARHIQDFGGET